MKTIGIIGGMSAESTALYYQTINRAINARLGGNHSASIVLHSLDFARIVALQQSGDWQSAGDILADSARKLQSIGADFILLATNTMHKVADHIESAITIPFLHVIDATAQAISARGLQRIGLLGTRFTMTDPFYRERMARHGIELIVPDPAMQDDIHRIIFEELCVNRIEPSSKARYQQAIAELQARGAEGIILGCTEICLLIGDKDTPLPLFDSTALHALAAVDAALASDGAH